MFVLVCVREIERETEERERERGKKERGKEGEKASTRPRAPSADARYLNPKTETRDPGISQYE